MVLVITDDQGYGDLGVHGNPMIRTPNLDRLHAQSVRLTNFHVDPTCSPTRAALLTGRYSTRTGVWHTIAGRSLMRTEELTVAEALAAAGYATGLFGKWHLGDNAPLRPQDQGFQEVLTHGGGGVGQTPDAWGNDYVDDTYFRNGLPTRFRGYCTDVWFDNALRFIEDHRERPFFACIATNAPHAPYNVDEAYSRTYVEAGVPQPMANFYGMITNIDENLGRLLETLDALGLADDTILIFMTDNGTAAGVARNAGPGRWPGFNAGMRGQKGSQYEGGHRVPCFVRHPGGNIGGGRDVDTLTAHIDLLPTLIDLCGVERPSGPPLDGVSLRTLLEPGSNPEPWPERILIVHSQRVETPIPWRQCSVMTDRWRLVDGQELYDIQADPGQNANVADAHPEVVARLRDAYAGWWSSLAPAFDDVVPIVIGRDPQPAHINCHDWHPTRGDVPWNQPMVSANPDANGFWALDVAVAGRYRVTMRQRPAAAAWPIAATEASLRFGEREDVQPVPAGATSVAFELEVPAGPAHLVSEFRDAAGSSRGAFYIDIERVEADPARSGESRPLSAPGAGR